MRESGHDALWTSIPYGTQEVSPDDGGEVGGLAVVASLIEHLHMVACHRRQSNTVAGPHELATRLAMRASASAEEPVLPEQVTQRLQGGHLVGDLREVLLLPSRQPADGHCGAAHRHEQTRSSMKMMAPRRYQVCACKVLRLHWLVSSFYSPI